MPASMIVFEGAAGDESLGPLAAQLDLLTQKHHLCFSHVDIHVSPPVYLLNNLSLTSLAKSLFNFHSWNSTTHALWPTTL